MRVSIGENGRKHCGNCGIALDVGGGCGDCKPSKLSTERTPLAPIITASEAGPVRLCNCCQSADRVLALGFGWRDWPVPNGRLNGGSTSVSLCRSCRDELRLVMSRIDGGAS